MKTPLFRSTAFVVFCLITLAPLAAASADSSAINLSVRTEGEALAKGFEEAFTSLSNAPVFITYAREDKGFVTLSGIRSVRALGAVLLIRTERGPTLALPARAVVVITDERPLAP